MIERFLIILLMAALAPANAEAQAVKAPWPTFLSAEAKGGLAADAARQPEPPTMEERRARADAIQREVGMPRLARHGVAMQDEVIAGVPVRLFTPRNAHAKAPILLNLHGGGFLVDSGSITENADMAARTGYPVVAVRYRLAPEHPFPAATDDALAVYRALIKDQDPRRIGLYGTSAGAILSAELVARLRAEKLPQPAALGFFSGTADLLAVGDSAALFADASGVEALARLYAGRRAIDDPLLSPQRGDLTGWPATLCLASTRDFLLSGTANFCRALDAAGVPAQLTLFDGLPHAFWAYIDAPETDSAFAAMARFFTERLGEKP
jgi:monoterpene epsilon-lactone hydrolase